MKIKLVAAFVCLLIASPFFAQSGKTVFNGSTENLDIESYPKKLKDYLKDAKSIAKIKSKSDFVLSVSKLYDAAYVNAETKTKIELEPASIAFYNTKIIEQIKAKDLRQSLFLDNMGLLGYSGATFDKLEQYLYGSYINVFDLKNKDSLARELAITIGRNVDGPKTGQDGYEAIPMESAMPPADIEQSPITYFFNGSRELGSRYLITYLIKGANDFADLVKNIDVLSRAIDKIAPPQQPSEEMSAPADGEYDGISSATVSIDDQPVELSTQLALMQKVLEAGLKSNIDYAKEKFDSSRFYDFVSRVSAEEQYSFITNYYALLIEKDRDRFTSYLKVLATKEFDAKKPIPLSNLLFAQLTTIAYPEEFRDQSFMTGFAKEIDVLSKVYFGKLTQNQISSLFWHLRKLDRIRQVLGGESLGELPTEDLKSANIFKDFVRVYYFSDIFKKLPVTKITKDQINTIALFFDPQNPNYATKFVPFVNTFDKPLFHESLSYYYSQSFDALFASNVRDEIFEQRQLDNLTEQALQSDSEGPAKKRAIKSVIAELKRTSYDFSAVPQFYANLVFNNSDVFKSLPDGTSIKNYSGNFGEGVESLVASKKIKFVFDKDRFYASGIFKYDSYKAYKDTLSLDEFVDAYAEAIRSSDSMPPLSTTTYYQKNKLALMTKFSERISNDTYVLGQLLQHLDDKDFEVFSPLFLSQFAQNATLIADLIVSESKLVTDRAYGLIEKMPGTISEDDFTPILYFFLANRANRDDDELKYFNILVKKAASMNLAERFRFESNFEDIALYFLEGLNFDAKVMKQFDTWSLNWKKMVDDLTELSKNEDYYLPRLKELKAALTKNKIDFKKQRTLKTIDEDNYVHDYYRSQFDNSRGGGW